MLVAFLHLTTGCNYYRARQSEVSAPAVTKLAESKIFLIHEPNGLTWELLNPRLNGEILEGTRRYVPDVMIPYLAVPPKGESPRYQSKFAQGVLNLVHVHISTVQAFENGPISIALADIKRIDLIEKNSGKTTASYVLGTIGTVAGAMMILAIVIVLTKSSCPFVYAHDGEQYRFVGEAYGGAIFAPAERNDYLPLSAIQAQQNEYHLKITNELKERQYTNLAELWVVQHPSNTRVLLDKRGGVQTITHPQTPLRAVSVGGTDYAQQLQATDHNAFLFNENTPGATPNQLVLSFAKPAGVRTGKLVLHAQNSLWLDYLYGKFTQKFGSYYNQWTESQKQVPGPELIQWSLDQGIPLRVYVEAGQGWQLVDYIPPVGPLASRDLVVPLPLPDVPAGQPVRVKLETGFMFWELDYAALDCSPNQPVTLEKCRPTIALDERKHDQQANLAADDDQYLQQLRPGSEVTLTYQPQQPNQPLNPQRSVFLRTKGYYEPIRAYEGVPDLPALYGFRKPGRFIEYSKEQYQQTAQEINLATNY